MARLIAYYRVSTRRQGESGLGLEAQKAEVAAYAQRGRHQIIAEFTEVESGRKDRRPELEKALAEARRHRATLAIAKLDRLSRNASFLFKIRGESVPIVACDMPELNSLMFAVLAGVAEYERELISKRTRDALAGAKARGRVLGRKDHSDILRVPGWPEGVKAIKAAADSFAAIHTQTLADLEADGFISYGAQARELTRLGIPTARGKTEWAPSMVRALKLRIAALPA